MQILNKYNEQFKQALASLNENQLKAVNQLDGPVLVIAGPGTGKTQILAARIGKILLDTDTQAHNILCLTYTEAGAVAMRKRLFEFIGPEAYRVNIYTFHAFCNDIIQENLDYFGKLELDVLSDLERIDLFRKLVNSFDKDHPLKRFRGDVYYEIKRLQNLFATMKREDWSGEFISDRIDEYIELVQDSEPGSSYYADYKYQKKYKDKQPGELKPAFNTLLESLEKLRAAAKEFPAYRKLMQQMNRYDYDDMILWVLEAFKKDEYLLLNYQERFQYVLVDEYQDTSGSQNELIQLLISYWDTPNIFVVGDDDQSIFRFQGANVQNIEAYHATYAHQLYQVMLTDNYRSSQHILDTARVLIEQNKERVKLQGLSKHLLAKNAAYAHSEVKPVIRAYGSQFQEFAHITRQVENLISQGIAPQEIAIIYKEHRSGEELARYFQLKDIAVNTKKKVNILTEPFGKKIINLLRYVAAEQQFPYSGDGLLFELMHYDFYQVEPMDIAKFSVEVSQQNHDAKERTSIRRKLYELARMPEAELNTESLKQIQRLSNDLEYWIKEAANLTLHNLFEKMMVRGGLLAYVLQSADKTWLMQMLTSIFNFLKDESRKKPDLSLVDFVSLLDSLEEHDLPLSLTHSIFNETGVHFLTCHSAKGLEFDYVFLVGANRKVWEEKRKNTSGEFKLPDTVFSSLANTSDLEELRRLFYVAITRARKELVISYVNEDSKGKPQEATLFIGEIKASTDLLEEFVEVPTADLEAFFVLQFSADERINPGLIDGPYIDHLLEKYSLSVTHLNNYLDCPLKFYFNNLIRVPSGKNDTMTFGSAVHWALNKLFRTLPNNNLEFHSIERFMDDFKWYMKRNREAFTDEQYTRRLEHGDKILPAYYERYAAEWNKNTLTEHKIKQVEIGGIPVKGDLDKIEFVGKQITIVDYKTGSYENAKAKLKPADEKNILGGDYWRQAVFYRLLVENDPRHDWEVNSVDFDFIEPYNDEYVKAKVLIKPEDLKIVRTQIKETFENIKNHRFDGCGKEDCNWCTFVRNNFQAPDTLLELAGADENSTD